MEDEGLAEAMRRTCNGERVWLLAVEPEEARTRLAETLKKANLTPKERKVFALLLRQHPNA
jgi:hypothetical protein